MSQSAKPSASDPTCFSFQVFVSVPELSTNTGLSVYMYYCDFLTFQVPALGFWIILWFPTHLPHPLIALPVISLFSAKAASPFPNVSGSPQRPSLIYWSL